MVFFPIHRSSFLGLRHRLPPNCRRSIYPQSLALPLCPNLSEARLVSGSKRFGPPLAANRPPSPSFNNVNSMLAAQASMKSDSRVLTSKNRHTYLGWGCTLHIVAHGLRVEVWSRILVRFVCQSVHCGAQESRLCWQAVRTMLWQRIMTTCLPICPKGPKLRQDACPCCHKNCFSWLTQGFYLEFRGFYWAIMLAS